MRMWLCSFSLSHCLHLPSSIHTYMRMWSCSTLPVFTWLHLPSQRWECDLALLSLASTSFTEMTMWSFSTLTCIHLLHGDTMWSCSTSLLSPSFTSLHRDDNVILLYFTTLLPSPPHRDDNVIFLFSHLYSPPSQRWQCDLPLHSSAFTPHRDDNVILLHSHLPPPPSCRWQCDLPLLSPAFTPLM